MGVGTGRGPVRGTGLSEVVSGGRGGVGETSPFVGGSGRSGASLFGGHGSPTGSAADGKKISQSGVRRVRRRSCVRPTLVLEVLEHALRVGRDGFGLAPRRGGGVGVLEQVAGGETGDPFVVVDDPLGPELS